MADPTVCAVMLTADRPELARRAVESFRSQTYSAKRLLMLDTGVAQLGLETVETRRGEFYVRGERGPILTSIGELRNAANGIRHFDEPDILIHWDDDDWSHPSRITEQVALLRSSGADCVGYNEMLFWREPHGFDRSENNSRGEAWLYSNPNPGYALGTSLCYWRKTWERKPFPATSVGEDLQFITGLKCVGVSTLAQPCTSWRSQDIERPTAESEPRMIARIHAGNTITGYKNIHREPMWKRVPEWDAHLRSVME